MTGSRFKQIRDAIKAGVPEDEAVATALGVQRSGKKQRVKEDQDEDVPALPSMADAFKRSKVRKRKG